ncbi:hypothetical protein T02_14485 [Trichinella nativa]|uniref:Uncharacterized protein n=1 Tax=Trichinella nativa TaxID=6335 RepID=A0A0V1L6T4_9BILA|nr:hypothetical protein T02_14485 [Trichinella nativa]
MSICIYYPHLKFLVSEISEIRYHSNNCSMFSSFDFENSSPRQAKRNGKRPYMHRSGASQLAVGWLVTTSFSLGLSSATENLNG